MELEFYNAKELTREPLQVRLGKEWMPASHLDENIIHRLACAITDQPPAVKCMRNIQLRGVKILRDIVLQFSNCNFANLDKMPHLDDQDKIHPENVDCGHKRPGEPVCPYAREFCVHKHIYTNGKG